MSPPDESTERPMDEEEEALIWQDVLDDIVAGRVTNLLCPFCKKNPVTIDDAAKRAEVEAFLEGLDEDDDVQNIYVGLA